MVPRRRSSAFLVAEGGNRSVHFQCSNGEEHCDRRRAARPRPNRRRGAPHRSGGRADAPRTASRPVGAASTLVGETGWAGTAACRSARQRPAALHSRRAPSDHPRAPARVRREPRASQRSFGALSPSTPCVRPVPFSTRRLWSSTWAAFRRPSVEGPVASSVVPKRVGSGLPCPRSAFSRWLGSRKRGRIRLRTSFDEWCDAIEGDAALLLLPLERRHVMGYSPASPAPST